MNRNSKKHENILIAVILICTCANLIFNVLLVKNALSCRKMLREAETLAQRAGAVKENAPKDTDETVQREETEERESLAEETEATEAEATESEELPPWRIGAADDGDKDEDPYDDYSSEDEAEDEE